MTAKSSGAGQVVRQEESWALPYSWALDDKP